jgi:hypothetical protein
MNDFSKKTIGSLTRKGVSLIGLTVIPGNGDMPFANGDRGYILNDNGTQRVLLFSQVMELAG